MRCYGCTSRNLEMVLISWSTSGINFKTVTSQKSAANVVLTLWEKMYDFVNCAFVNWAHSFPQKSFFHINVIDFRI